MSQRHFKDLSILSDYFTFSVFFIVFLSSVYTVSMHKETSPLISMLYIVYLKFLLYNVLYTVGNIY